MLPTLFSGQFARFL